ncbi:MAG: UvrD-helicase domain-containing protein, partial [Kiritimatiellia bacterium]
MSAPVQIRSAAMAASAGTGKTFALSSRYLALLARGAEPASIVALTFTRKAAGEILARILTRLAQAAESEPGCAQLNRQLAEGGLPGFADRDAAQAALRALVHALPGLRIGTLDSFFLQILRQFRLEYGIAADPSVAPEAQTAEEDLVLQRLLGQKAASAAERGELMEAFKRATFGEEKKSVYGAVRDLIGNQYALYRRAPDPAAWGDAARIWTGGLPVPQELDWPAVFEALSNQADALKPGQARDDWNRFVAGLDAACHGGEFDFKSVLAERLYRAYADPQGIRDSVQIRRTEISLPAATQAALASAFALVRYAILGKQIARTRGLYQLLSAYGRNRRDHVVRSGQLAFNDIAHLLDPASGPAPARLRTLMDFRLDARFRHWLLDEFQDTSLLQWSVIENLVDEVLQNPDGDRTLFYVGDVKQAIYQWRGGDPRLFRRILAKYNRPGAEPAIAEPAPLVHSWRSSPVVLDAVNRVFGSLPAMPLPANEQLRGDWPEIAAQWTREWTAHEAADPNRDLAGHVALHVLPRPSKEDNEEAEEMIPPPIRRAAELVEQLRDDIPEFERLSVALLARSNPDGLNLLGALGQKGIRAVWAGNSELLDNTLIPAILSFAKLIEHPGDEFARRHVQMSALAAALSLAPAELAAWGRLVREQGYAGFATRLASRLDLRAAPLERDRLRRLVSIAAEFDRQPDGTALLFCSFVQAQEVPAEQSGSNVHILTMHKAKGLEYDVVILPALGTNGITAHSKEPLLVREKSVNEPNP